jgi:transcription elongation factor
MDKIIDKIATVQRDSDSKFLDIEKKRLEMNEKICPLFSS